MPDPLNLLATKDVTSMINPSKLKSLVDSQAAPPSAAAMGMAPSPDGAPDMDDMDEGAPAEEGADEGGDPIMKGNELLDSWGEFGATMRESADLIMDAASEVGAELLLQEVPEDAKDEVHKAVDRMPEDVQIGLAKYISELDEQGIEAVTAAMVVSMGEATDTNMIESFLKEAGAYAKDTFDVPEEEPEEDEEDDAEDDADAEGGDVAAEGDAAAAPADVPPAE